MDSVRHGSDGGQPVNRGEVWWAVLDDKSRPVVVLTRQEVIDVRELLTVAELTTSVRGLMVEVPVDENEAGVPEETVVNCDGIYTVRHSSLHKRVGSLTDATMRRVCYALTYALGC